MHKQAGFTVSEAAFDRANSVIILIISLRAFPQLRLRSILGLRREFLFLIFLFCDKSAMRSVTALKKCRRIAIQTNKMKHHLVEEKEKKRKLNSRKSDRWSAVPMPCLSRLWLKLRGMQGSGPKGIDDLCFLTGEFSPPPPPPLFPPHLQAHISA